jgi:hypothetical protein
MYASSEYFPVLKFWFHSLCQCGATLAAPNGLDHVLQVNNIAATGLGAACNINPNEYCGAPGYSLVYTLRPTKLNPGSISNPWINPGNGQWGYAGTYSDPELNGVFRVRSDGLLAPIVFRNFVDVSTCLEFCSVNGHNLADAATAGTSNIWQYTGLVRGGFVSLTTRKSPQLIVCIEDVSVVLGLKQALPWWQTAWLPPHVTQMHTSSVVAPCRCRCTRIGLSWRLPLRPRGWVSVSLTEIFLVDTNYGQATSTLRSSTAACKTS